MSGPAAGLMAPPDRAEIDELLARYCFAIDRRDWDGLREVFASDAVITYSGPRVAAGINEIVEFFRAAVAATAATQHLLHTSRVWPTGPGTAGGLSHVTAHHVGHDVVLPAAEAATYTVTGTYDDRFTRTPDGWRIARRSLTLLTTAGDPAILRPALSDQAPTRPSAARRRRSAPSRR